MLFATSQVTDSVRAFTFMQSTVEREWSYFRKRVLHYLSLTSYPIVVAIKAMRIRRQHAKSPVRNVFTVQIGGRWWYADIRIRRITVRADG